MRMKSNRCLLPAFVLTCLIFGCGRQPIRQEKPLEDHSVADRASDIRDDDSKSSVRVAAIQCHSRMGDTEGNIRNLVSLIRQAARAGAKIVVTPEASVHGYMHPASWTSWAKEDNHPFSVGHVAETVPGPATKTFSDLARELGVYLCMGFIEAAEDRYYNAQALFGPDGALLARHRKRALWAPGDSSWCSSGNLPVQVVESPYGKLGMMICYDFHVLPPELARAGADIVLYSLGWYGPNEDNWFRNIFPRKAVIPHGFSVIAANWSGETDNDTWPGRGHSAILARNGDVLAMARTVTGNEVVLADIPLRKREPSKP